MRLSRPTAPMTEDRDTKPKMEPYKKDVYVSSVYPILNRCEHTHLFDCFSVHLPAYVAIRITSTVNRDLGFNSNLVLAYKLQVLKVKQIAQRASPQYAQRTSLCLKAKQMSSLVLTPKLHELRYEFLFIFYCIYGQMQKNLPCPPILWSVFLSLFVFHLWNL